MIVLYILLGALGLWLVISLIRAVFFVPKREDYGEMPHEDVDTERAVRNLSGAIQIPTISYPEEELVDWAQFEKFHAYLEKTYPLIHQTMTREVVSRASLLYRWKGEDSSLDAIALLSHQDVVPVSEGTEDDWKYPAFDGHNDGEFLWGRGALDMKNHLICVMEAVETLLAEGFVPKRDVYLCFGHNEEVVGSDNSGAGAMMETLRERGVHLDSVLDEGGAFLPVKVKGILDACLAGVGISEKGYADFEISVNAKGGHSSQPPDRTALGDIAEVILDLESNQFKAKLMPFMLELLNNVGRNLPYYLRVVACNIGALRPLLKAVMKRIPVAACLIRTTTAATMAQGSPAANVLPQKATINVNFRMMPGTSIKDVENHIRKVVRNKDIEVKFVKGKEASKFSPTDSRAFQTIKKLCLQQEPDAIVAPYLVMGGTDACFYEPICENVNRFAPFKITTELLQCTHATNERIPVETIGNGVAFFKQYVRQMAGE